MYARGPCHAPIHRPAVVRFRPRRREIPGVTVRTWRPTAPTRAPPTPAPTTTSWVGLSYDDPLAARAWLRELGFDEGILVQDEAGAVEHSEMLWPEGGRVMVSSRATGHDTF